MVGWGAFQYKRKDKKNKEERWAPPGRLGDMENVNPESSEQPTPTINSLRRIATKKKKHVLCGCFNWKICVFILILFLILLGIAVFFLYPRTPQVR